MTDTDTANGTWYVFREGDVRSFGDKEAGGAAAARYAGLNGGGYVVRIPHGANVLNFAPKLNGHADR